MRLDWLWFLGLDLDSEAPHHSVLSEARKRWGAEVFEELFVQGVRRCVEAETVVADSPYGTNENFAWCGSRGVLEATQSTSGRF